MTGSEIITRFENMVGDSLDSDYMYQLMNDAKDEVEGYTAWEQLKKETSYSVSAGYSFTSSLGSLPTRFAIPVKMVEDASFTPYDKIDFEDRASRALRAYGYFIDLANSTIYLSGVNHSAKTMYFYYTSYSPDITPSTSWAFPDRFHSIIPLKMAEIYYLSDAGERGRSWDDKWAVQYERALAGMVAWNDKLKLANRVSSNMNRTRSPKAVY
jgi:hypothetical protein